MGHEPERHDHDRNCVCNVLLDIVEAQNEVEDSGCDTSCNRAIQELVHGTKSSPFNTIPVILFCKGTCSPFVGVGVKRSGLHEKVNVGVSVVFRVVDVDPNTCCAILELLQFEDPKKDAEDLLEDLDKDPKPFENTNVCITADLNNFSAVTCLPPINL
jgi:spore coat protein Z